MLRGGGSRLSRPDTTALPSISPGGDPWTASRTAAQPHSSRSAMKEWAVISVLVLQSVHGILCGPAHREEHNSTRRYRSGGFPKFPTLADDLGEPAAACGTRAVEHQPPRAGAPAPKVVGGVAARYGAYPWTAEIQVYRAASRQHTHQCGGALIGARLVVTAAHCVQGESPDRLRVVLGEHRLGAWDPHEQVFKVDKVVSHPSFRKAGTYSHDIAVARLKAAGGRGAQFGPKVRPICLPERGAAGPDGMWCVVTGWGAQNPEDVQTQSEELHAAAVSLLNLDVCRDDAVYGGRRQSILDSMLCAGVLEGGVDACGGDSGGPLACEMRGKFMLMGLVSWGDGCAKKNRPGVYTRISYYVDWINEVSKQLAN
ncbi:urokinase-type plasminogen activator-like isoform X2 [Bacillus rossius redtenbacheri]|uniref:urokinase-type plasminogen activator-like isoform X2 n=1 Tax=Bacillus rossius redtenbacheri TaxID=93214 RepID=UPI002FDD7CFF